ncbi:hypothetical protein A2T76_03165 [Pseudomonas brenneri]|nr:hypothetical protein A2T76_03165 [Pseudomonas brenneri]
MSSFQACQDRLAGGGVFEQLGRNDLEERLECIEVQKKHISLVIVSDELGAGCRCNQFDIRDLPALQFIPQLL